MSSEGGHLESDSSALGRLDETLRERLFGRSPHIGLIRIAEDLIHYVVAVVLVGIAGVVLYRAVHDLITSKPPFTEAATTAINGVLFAIIVLEVMRTVVAHFDKAGLQLQPFLIIGIISAVRGILSVGARLSLGSGVKISDAVLELGIDAAVVLVLTVSLVLVRRYAATRERHSPA